MKKLSLMSLLCLHLTAQASYMNQCLLKGTIESEPERMRIYFTNPEGLEIEREEWHFRFKITDGQVNGRADSGCCQKIGDVINIVLPEPDVGASPLKIAQKITVNELIANEKGSEPIHHFSLVKP